MYKQITHIIENTAKRITSCLHTAPRIVREGLGVGLMALLLSACTSSPTLPSQFATVDSLPAIYPDYANVTIPCNIAPLTFMIEEGQEDIVASWMVGSKQWVIGSKEGVCPTEDQWKEMKESALKDNGKMTVEVYAQKDGQWTKYQSFSITVSPDSIDPYISYRLISPSYVTYEGLTINQRCLENYDEEVIYSNMINTTEKDGQCINCHSFQNYNPERMQFHARQHLGGTIITYDGHVEKHAIGSILTIEANGDTIKGSGVYPAWHPTEPLIAYSSNRTGQTFYTYDPQKVEVQDTYSNLILYDINSHKVYPLEKDTNDLDCFPAWSPDGKYLYYCSAHYEKQDSSLATTKEMDLIMHHTDVHYNLYRRSFDLKTKKFGSREMVYDAAADTMSATLPRISPDGTKLLFTRGRYGVFHIWHNTSDLYMIDLSEKLKVNSEKEAAGDDASVEENHACAFPAPRRLDDINSPETESYHSWSSNGKWIIFSSRRHDGNFTRPFMAHMNADGSFTRPFELPQARPDYHLQFLRSYNIPEFMSGPVTITPQKLAKVIRGE